MKETVLVVDDDKLIRRSIRRILELVGLQVVEAPGGFEALEALRSAAFNMVMLDVNMPPSLNGPETFERLRKDFPDLPVLFVTSDTRRLNGILGQPQVGLVEKPFDKEHLVAVVRRMLA